MSKPKLRRAKCETCIFGPNSPLRSSGLRDHLARVKRRKSHARCHHDAVVGSKQRVICRGWLEHEYRGDMRILAVALCDEVD